MNLRARLVFNLRSSLAFGSLCASNNNANAFNDVNLDACSGECLPN